LKRHLPVLLAALALLAPSAWQGAAQAAPQKTGDKVIAEFLEAFDRLNNFKGQVQVDTKNGRESSHMKAELNFEKPHHIAFKVLDYPQMPITNGSKIAWLGEGKAKVHTRLFGLPLTLPFPLEDPRLCDIRGDSIRDVSIVTAVNMMRTPGARFRYLGENRWKDHPVDMVEVKSPKLLKGIEREVIWFDQAAHFPWVRDMYENGEVVFHFTFDFWNLNLPLPPETFTQV
jgi:outer membrane lipoprotein-sorting protein